MVEGGGEKLIAHRAKEITEYILCALCLLSANYFPNIFINRERSEFFSHRAKELTE
jgi:hypothetical protein